MTRMKNPAHPGGLLASAIEAPFHDSGLASIEHNPPRSQRGNLESDQTHQPVGFEIVVPGIVAGNWAFLSMLVRRWRT